MRQYVYVIGREEGPVKVGVSANPWSRASGLQTGCPFELKVLHAQEMRDRAHALDHERHFHAVYETHKLVGEWFDIDADLAIEGIETSLQLEEHFAGRE